MKSYLVNHVHVFFKTLRRFFAHPLANLLSVCVIGVTLSLPLGLYVFLLNVQTFSRQIDADPQLSVFLELDAGADDISAIQTRLRQQPNIAAWRYVSRAQALQEFKNSTGLSDVVEGLGHNPLPDGFFIKLNDNQPTAVTAIHNEIKRWPKIARVEVDSAWVKRLDAALQFGRLVVFMITGLLSFALVAVTFNTIRLQILTQREEIEVARLIGATNPFIRRPFLYMGGLQGLIGGAFALGIVVVSIHLLNEALDNLSQLYGTSFALHPLNLADSLTLLVFSMILGWIGAYLSVSKYLWRAPSA